MSSAPGVATSCCGSCPTRHHGYLVTSRQRGAGACACAVLLQEGKVRGACGTARQQSLHCLQQFDLLVLHWETTMGRLSKSLRNEKMQAYVRQADKTLLDLQPPGRALTYLLPQPEEPAPSPGCSHPVPQLPWVSTPAEGPGGSMLAPAPGSEGSHQSGRAAARLGTVVQVNAPSTAPVGMPAPPSAAQIQPASDPCHVMRVQGCGSLFTPQHPRGLSAFLGLFLPLPWAYAIFLSSEVYGTETHTALYSEQLCPAHLPSVCHPPKTHTHIGALSPEWCPHLLSETLPQTTWPPDCTGCSERGLLLSAPALEARLPGQHLSLKGGGENRSWGQRFPAQRAILEQAWLLKHNVLFAFLSFE